MKGKASPFPCRKKHFPGQCPERKVPSRRSIGKTLVVEQRRCRIRISVSDRRISPSYQVVFSQGALPRYSKNMKVEMRHVASGPAAVCRAYGVFPAGRTIRANVLEKPYSPSCFPPGKEAERLTGTLRVLADVGG